MPNLVDHQDPIRKVVATESGCLDKPRRDKECAVQNGALHTAAGSG